MRGGPSVASVPDAQVGQGWVDGSAGWVANEGIFDAVFAPVTSAILGAAAIEPGQRVLDVGCGTGTLLAAAVATGATAVGVDVSPGMVEAARRRVPSATVIVDDAETADILARAPGAAFDRVVSRFGVMFFPDPVAAFTNLRRATAPGSRLVFACWRAKEDNPMFTLGTSVLEERLNPRPTPPPPGTPGPTSLADPDRPASVLGDAGWTSVDLAPLDVVLDYGTTGGNGVEARLAMVLAGSTVICHSGGVFHRGLSSGASSLPTMSAGPVTDLVLADRSPGPKWSGGAMAVAVDRAAAVDRLPGSDHQDPYQRLAMAFLVGCPANSARAYLGDLKAWGTWGAGAGPLGGLRERQPAVRDDVFHLGDAAQNCGGDRSSLAGAESEVVLLVKAPKSRYVSAAGRRV
jgi:hypothetical protein